MIHAFLWERVQKIIFHKQFSKQSLVNMVLISELYGTLSVTGKGEIFYVKVSVKKCMKRAINGNIIVTVAP